MATCFEEITSLGDFRMDMQGQNTKPKETTKHSQSEEKANQHNEAKKKRILSPVLKLIGLGTEATATAFFAMILPFLLPALLGLGVLGGLSVAIKALWPKSVQPEMAISQIREIKEFKVLKLCLEDVVTQNYQDREFQFVARGDAVYGVEFDKITCTVKEENKEKILIVEVPYPKLLNSRINYDNEERQGKGIENWKYDNKNLPDKVALKLTNERGIKAEAAIRNLALKADFQMLARKQTMELLKSLFKGAKQKVIFQWQKENMDSKPFNVPENK